MNRHQASDQVAKQLLAFMTQGNDLCDIFSGQSSVYLEHILTPVRPWSSRARLWPKSVAGLIRRKHVEAKACVDIIKGQSQRPLSTLG